MATHTLLPRGVAGRTW